MYFCGITVITVCLSMLLAPGNAKEFESLRHLKSQTSPSDQQAAVEQMLSRLIGDRSSMFSIRINPSTGPPNRDTFLLMLTDNRLTVTGTSGVAAAMGFYFYIKQYCGCQYTWAGENLNIPDTLPAIPPSGIKITSNDQFRYYQNVCTVSYSFAWWDWSRWQREIDWMALQGINLPLAFTGQEAIFSRVYMSLGFTWEDLQEHFGGPAFLAWARMGNIRGWGGPLPQSWIVNRLVLQHKILKRMRSFGMVPVLPGFAGHVPSAITRLFPQANVTRLRAWSNFGSKYSETYLLDFEDPLFKKIGGSFIKAMENEFGVDHIYNADTFNEMVPRSSKESYLASASKAVYEALVAGDQNAIWLMQGWLFMNTRFWKPPQIKALLTGVPQGKMIILDLQAELARVYARTESFYGQPFIWCMLHNFGGTMELYGALDNINTGPFKGRKFANSTMVGTGLTPEGIDQNEVVYEFMNENAWRTEARNVTQWISSFHQQRYGIFDEHAESAWQLLKKSVYGYNSTVRFHGKGGFIKRPTLHVHQRSSVYNSTDGHKEHSHDVTVTTRPQLFLKPDASTYNCKSGHRDFNTVLFTRLPNLAHSEYIWYEPEMLFQAWDEILKATTIPRDSKLYRYDLVDITRNSLQIASVSIYKDLIMAFTRNDSKALVTAGEELVDLLSDLDTLLASDGHFLLGSWVAAAKALGGSEVELIILYMYNAKNQISLWGPRGEILDYAAKQWSGLINDYYKGRWQLFVDMLVQSLKEKKKFNQNAYNKEVFTKVEQPFAASTKDYPTTTTGDSIQIATSLHKKWRPKTLSPFLKNFKRWSAGQKIDQDYQWKYPESRYRNI